MRQFLVVAAAVGLLTACGGSSPEPTATPTPSPSPATTSRPTGEITYTGGSAEVTVSGGEQGTATLPLDTTQASFSPDTGFDVWWRSGDQALNLAGDVKKGEADVFVRVETPGGHAYVDAFHTQCDVTVTSYDDTALAGTFTCDELLVWDGDTTDASPTASPQPVTASGTFSATAGTAASASS